MPERPAQFQANSFIAWVKPPAQTRQLFMLAARMKQRVGANTLGPPDGFIAIGDSPVAIM
jgi:hypothetical protein